MEAKKFGIYDSEWSTQLGSITQDTVLRAVEDLIYIEELEADKQCVRVALHVLTENTWKLEFTIGEDESIRMLKEMPLEVCDDGEEGTEAEN